ncbi:penicillin-binding protein [Shouchella lonarensis]|uniref:serine-type D-Ala-D-Ala carboxypeptidase n=1 Tax=Shouchella lonarensis TaxID=1464122 RepID=A0A1G6HXX5_9BACI|nr:penicillin-binding protein [Shouchella lonarensis]
MVMGENACFRARRMISRGDEKVKRNEKWLKACVLTAGLLWLSACGTETPEDAVSKYIEDWHAEAYDKMYARLTKEAQANISEEAFVKRHENIYALISELQVKPTFPESFSGEETDEIKVDVSMDTIAEPVSFTEALEVVLEESDEGKEWKIAWKPQLIFPELEGDDEVSFDRFEATRGELYAADGEVLAGNGEVVEIGFKAGNVEEGSVESVAEAFPLDVAYIQSQLEQGWVKPDSYVPLMRLPASEEEYALKMANEIPGLMRGMKSDRVYPLGEAAAHLTGYIAQVTAEDLEDRAGEGYHQQSKIGKTGLEAVFESRLRGEDGVEIYTKDATGEKKHTISEKEMAPGEDIHLTIDPKVQQTVYEQLKEEAGVGVVLHPTTGETLALVSAPTYDPNKLALGWPGAYAEAASEENNSPMLNRFTASYSPGSTFKPFTAALGLKEGTLDPQASMTVSGREWQPEGSDWGTHKVKRVSDYGEPVDLNRALVYSDNIYFAQHALELGEERMISFAEELGFGEPFPYSYGLKPSSFTNEDGFDNDIQLADTGYGQGQVLMNPVHLTALYTAFVNDGKVIQPVLDQKEEKSKVWKEVFTPEITQQIDQALVEVVTDKRGTAHGMQVDGKSLAAKTGTAQVTGDQGEQDEDLLGWIVAYDREPGQLVVALMQEGASSGDLINKMNAVFTNAQ